MDTLVLSRAVYSPRYGNRHARGQRAVAVFWMRCAVQLVKRWADLGNESPVPVFRGRGRRDHSFRSQPQRSESTHYSYEDEDQSAS